jgi:hypothetical protein
MSVRTRGKTQRSSLTRRRLDVSGHATSTPSIDDQQCDPHNNSGWIESDSEPSEAVDELFERIEESLGLVDQDVMSGTGNLDETAGDEPRDKTGCGLRR